MAPIFISYSRKDVGVAESVVQALAEENLDTWIDWRNIPKGEYWEQEIYRGIEEADAFLFLMSPDSVRSTICSKEIAHAVVNKKRILPIVIRDAAADFQDEISRQEISKRNWIFCRGGKDDFTKAIGEVLNAIHTDYAWLKYHTRLQVNALEWQRNAQKRDFLLQGEELREAEIQLVANSSKEPPATDLQHDYVIKSRGWSDRQRRRLFSFVIGAAVVMAGLAVFGFVQAQIATANKNTAETASTQAIANAQEAKRQANAALARQLAVQAQSLFVTGDSRQMLSVLLAVQSMKMLPDRNEEAMKILQTNSLAITSVPLFHGTAVYSVVFSPDGKYIVSGGCDQQDAQKKCTQGSARLWEAATGREISYLIFGDRVTSVAFSRDGRYIASGSLDKTAHIWEAATGKEVARLTYDSAVTSVAFSPDGQYVASGSEDGTVLVWEVATGKEVAHMIHQGSVTSIAFSPDGQYLVSGSEDNSARVWDLRTGNQITRVDYTSIVYTVAFSPDGKYVVSGGCDQTAATALGICVQSSAHLWEAATGTETARMAQYREVFSVAFSPDGQYVVSGGCDEASTTSACARGSARVWEAATGKEIAHMIHDSYVNSVAFSPDGKYVVSAGCEEADLSYACGRGTARVWEAATGKEIARMTYDSSVTSVAFRPDGQSVVSGAEDGTVRLWKLASGDRIVRMTQNGPILAVALSPDSRFVVSGGCDEEIQLSWCPQGQGIARVWEVASGKEVAHVSHGNGVTSVAFSPDGEYVVSGGQEGTVKVWKASNGEGIAQMSPDSQDEISAVAFSPDGKHVASDGLDNPIIRVWEIATGREIANMADPSNSMTFSPDGKYILSRGLDRTARVWEAATGREVARMTYGVSVRVAAFSPDGRYVVSGGCDTEDASQACTHGTARVQEFSTGRQIARMTYHAAVRFVAFSPDSKYVLSGNSDNTVHVWELSTGREIARIAEDSSISSLAFSPDGKYLVSGSGSTVRFWEVATGKEFTRIAQNDAVKSVAFTPDGKYLVTREGDQTIVAWLYRPEDLINDACSRVTRNLTHAEWEQYIGEALPYQPICDRAPIEPDVAATPTTDLASIEATANP